MNAGCSGSGYYKNKRKDGMTTVADYKEQMYKNTFDFYCQWLSLIAMSRYKWKNLPESMNERFLEETLYFWGQAGIVDLTGNVINGSVPADEGLLNCRIAVGGQIDRYYDYTDYQAYFQNAETHHVSAERCVFVRNNYFRMPTVEVVEYYAYKLANIEMTIDQNIDAQRTPWTMETTQDQKLTLDNLYSDIRDFKPVIATNKEMGALDSIRVLKTDAPFTAPAMYSLKADYINECLTVLGINNVNIVKRERVQSAEVESNNDIIGLSADTELETRQQACVEANRKFNTDMSVSLKEVEIRPQILNGMLIGSQSVLSDDYDMQEYTGFET